MGWLKDLLLGKPKVMPVSVNDGNFQAEVFKSKVPVLLDVWGPGCQPCKRLESVIINLATKYQGKIKVAEINAAANPKTMRRLRVSGTPTVIFFKKGRELERVVGFRGTMYFEEAIEELFPEAFDEGLQEAAGGAK